jgi:hypothetical protein
MPIEGQVNNIADLNPAYPQADDPVSQGDNHVRNIKKALKDTFPNIDGTVLPSDEELNQLVGQDLPGDVTDLEGRVTKNEADIANNAADIATNASNIATNASNIATNASNIAKNTGDIATNANNSSINAGNIASNDSDIADLNSRVNALENAPAPGLTPHSLNDHTDVNTSGAQEGYVLAYVGGNWVPIKLPSGGGMIKPTQQPRTAGDFNYYPKEQAYMTFDTTGDTYGYVELTVPAGKVFSFEYLAAYGNCILDPHTIQIDGVTISGGSNFNGNDLVYDPNGGPTWPGNEGFNPIRVESSLKVRISSGTGSVYVSGIFVEE